MLETLAGPPFEPLHRCSLKLLTPKTVFLVSLASGRRGGAIRALSTAPGRLIFLPHGVRLVPQPSFSAKNQTLDFLPHLFYSKDFHFFFGFGRQGVVPGSGTPLVF